MRKDNWFRSALLSVLFLVLATTMVAGQDAAGERPTEAVRSEFVRNLLAYADIAYRNGDTAFLMNLAVMAYAGGPQDDLRGVEPPPATAQPEQLVRYLNRRVQELGADGLQVLTTTAASIQDNRLRLNQQVATVGWWGCLMDYLSSVTNCWQEYTDCTRPTVPGGPGKTPQEWQWCREQLTGCLQVAKNFYRRCRGDDSPPEI